MCGNAVTANNEKDVLHLPSISSFSSSASTEIGYPSSEHADDRTIKPKAFHCWRRKEVENLLFQWDETSIRRLSRFGLYDDDFAKLWGLEKFSSQVEDRLPFSNWGWSLHQLRKDGFASVASELSEKSRTEFESIPFEELYQHLSGMLHCKFIRKPQHKELLFQLKERLENGKADPFVCAATATAWEKVSSAENEHLDLKLNAALDLVIEPLQRTLKKPDSAQSILQELEELMVPFRTHFHTPKANWDVPFDEPVARLKSIGPSALAKALSEEDRVFYELNVQTSQEDPRVLRDINGRWNRLYCSVKECMDTGVVSALEMKRLARNLYRRHNFYSFTAVMSGIPSKRSLTHTPQKCAKLDLETDYKLAAQLTFMYEFYSVDASASSDDKMEYRSTTTENALERVGVMSVFKYLARQISLGSCLSCFGH